MVIVAGHVTVEPAEREGYLAGCVTMVEQGRRAAGCLDLAVTADLVDPSRINIFERWESQAVLDTYRRSAPSPGYNAELLSVSVREYDIAGERPLFGAE